MVKKERHAMLLEFTCSNYKSIHKRVKLSMIAGSDDTREDELIQYDKYRINRMSVRYGPNVSGKKFRFKKTQNQIKSAPVRRLKQRTKADFL